MIRYALACRRCGARFEAWFRNAASCDEQLASDAVLCPSCGASTVDKALMAPSVAPRGKTAPCDPQPLAAEPRAPAAAGASPPERPLAARRREMEHKLRALRAYVEATAEPMGQRFPDEARAIHEGEAEARPIYGDATPEEAEALREDGVPVAPIPWIDKTDD